MITVQVESLTDGLAELMPLLPEHWKELALAQDEVPLDPNYAAYIAADQRGEVIYVTLREDGALVGYFIAFCTWGLHYKSTLNLKMDICRVVPDARGMKGGQMMLSCLEDEFERRRRLAGYPTGTIWLGSKVHRPIARLWDANGYSLEETYHFKVVT